MLEDIKAQATKELKEEAFRKEVEREKERMRKGKSWFPWRIYIKVVNINRR